MVLAGDAWFFLEMVVAGGGGGLIVVGGNGWLAGCLKLYCILDLGFGFSWAEPSPFWWVRIFCALLFNFDILGQQGFGLCSLGEYGLWSHLSVFSTSG